MNARMVTALWLIVVLVAPVTFGQIGAPAKAGGKPSPHYDKATEMTVKGVVEEVSPTTTEKNRWAQIRLTLKSDQGTFDIHVGPAAYITSQQVTFAKGNKIEVVGSKVKIRGQDVLLARQITKDGKVLKLRDEQGFPLFAHRKRWHFRHDD